MTLLPRLPLLSLCDRRKLLCYHTLIIGVELFADGYGRVPKTTFANQERESDVAICTTPRPPIH